MLRLYIFEPFVKAFIAFITRAPVQSTDAQCNGAKSIIKLYIQYCYAVENLSK